VGTESEDGIDLLLLAKGRLTVVIKKGDEFHFSVVPIVGGDALNGIGGGPIRN